MLAGTLMKLTGMTPTKVARTCLDAARPRLRSTSCRSSTPRSAGQLKRHLPRTYTRALPASLGRLSPQSARRPGRSLTWPWTWTRCSQKIKDHQWALADIDWDAPGAETISDEFRPKLKAFMADLCWIENVGARGFAAMATKAPTPTIAEIYRYFHAEEQRHANAELALIKRWGMLEDGEIPEPSVNIRLAIEWLDKYADDMPLSVLGTVIPMLEVALDGALLKFLLEEVHDPVCHQVFEKINNDESRHIAVDFEVLDLIGHAKARQAARSSSSATSPRPA